MNYHLGRLRLEPDPLHLHPALAGRQGDPRFTLQGMLRQFLQLRRNAHTAPDLLAELRRDPGVDAWVCELAAALDRRPGVRLLHCEREPGDHGHVAIAVVDPSCAAAVRAESETRSRGVAAFGDRASGDLHCGGLAAVRMPGGDVEILPRIYRRVCTNGAVVLTRTCSDLLREAGTVHAAVDACLSPATTGAAFALLDAAARTPVADPVALLQLALTPAAAAAAWAGREDRDPTMFGVVNALTAHARRERSFARRFAIERGAARILAGVTGGPGRGERAARELETAAGGS
jgi:hypothetical protein